MRQENANVTASHHEGAPFVDANRFDDLARDLTASPSRRRIMRAFATAALAQAVPPGPGASVARKRKR